MDEAVIRIQGVPSSSVDHVWPDVQSWIAAALAEGKSLESIDDVRALIVNQDYQLWTVHAPGLVAAFVTRIATASNGSALVAVCLGGQGMNEWLFAVEDVISNFARSKGCRRVCLHGRRGWTRQLASYGWAEESVNVTKELQ